MLAKHSFLLFAVTAFLALIPASEGKEVTRDVLVRALRSADPGPIKTQKRKKKMSRKNTNKNKKNNGATIDSKIKKKKKKNEKNERREKKIKKKTKTKTKKRRNNRKLKSKQLQGKKKKTNKGKKKQNDERKKKQNNVRKQKQNNVEKKKQNNEGKKKQNDEEKKKRKNEGKKKQNDEGKQKQNNVGKKKQNNEGKKKQTNESKRKQKRRNKNKKKKDNKSSTSKKNKKKNQKKKKRGKNKKGNTQKTNKSKKRKGQKKVKRKNGRQDNDLVDTGDCLDTAVKSMKRWRDVVTNFEKQNARIEKQSGIASKKSDKKGAFGPIALKLVELGGGNKSSLSCAGLKETNGAKQLTNLTETLFNCEKDINSTCNPANFPEANATLISECTASIEIFKNETTKCMNSNPEEACACWTSSDYKDVSEAVTACKIAETNDVRDALRACQNDFSKCRKYEDDAIEIFSSCSRTINDLTFTVAVLSKNKDVLDEVKIKIELIIGSPRQRIKRAVATDCASFIALVDNCK